MFFIEAGKMLFPARPREASENFLNQAFIFSHWPIHKGQKRITILLKCPFTIPV